MTTRTDRAETVTRPRITCAQMARGVAEGRRLQALAVRQVFGGALRSAVRLLASSLDVDRAVRARSRTWHGTGQTNC